MHRLRIVSMFLVLSGAVLHGPASAQATTIVGGSTGELAASASLIIAGTVVSSEASYADSMIVTQTTIRVEQVYQGGVTSDEIIVVSPGGRVGDIATRVAGADTYSVGEHVLVFLQQGHDGSYGSVALAFSKFTLSPTEGGWIATRQADGAAVLMAGEDGRLIDAGDTFPTVIPLEELEQQIESTTEPEVVP